MNKMFENIKKCFISLCFVSASLSAYVPISEDDIEEYTMDMFATGNAQFVASDYLLQQDYVDAIYQMLKDTHEIFTAHNLEYWIDSGTLLGSVRQGGFLPWDDDVDLAMLKSEEQKFLDSLPVFEQYGYAYEPCSFGYKIYAKNSKKTEYQHTFPWIDIFIFDHYEDDNSFRIDPYRNDIPHSILIEIYYKKDLFPLREYQFGPLILRGPNNPVPYLDTIFKNWKTKVVMYNHVTAIDFLMDFDATLHTHAIPSKPLLDRVI